MRRLSMTGLLERMIMLGLLLCSATACTRPSVKQETVSPSPTSPSFSSPILATTMVSPLPKQDSPRPMSTLPPLTLEPQRGGIKGKVVNLPAEWADRQLYVYFSPFYPGERADEGIYVLEPAVHPSTEVGSGGDFQHGGIPPGQYVIVVGPHPREAIFIGEGGRPHIFAIVEGEVLEIGKVRLNR